MTIRCILTCFLVPLGLMQLGLAQDAAEDPVARRIEALLPIENYYQLGLFDDDLGVAHETIKRDTLNGQPVYVYQEERIMQIELDDDQAFITIVETRYFEAFPPSELMTLHFDRTTRYLENEERDSYSYTCDLEDCTWETNRFGQVQTQPTERLDFSLVDELALYLWLSEPREVGDRMQAKNLVAFEQKILPMDIKVKTIEQTESNGFIYTLDEADPDLVFTTTWSSQPRLIKMGDNGIQLKPIDQEAFDTWQVNHEKSLQHADNGAEVTRVDRMTVTIQTDKPISLPNTVSQTFTAASEDSPATVTLHQWDDQGARIEEGEAPPDPIFTFSTEHRSFFMGFLESYKKNFDVEEPSPLGLHPLISMIVRLDRVQQQVNFDDAVPVKGFEGQIQTAIFIGLAQESEMTARPVFGLAYDQRRDTFVPSMWVEAAVDGRWRPFLFLEENENAYLIRCGNDQASMMLADDLASANLSMTLPDGSTTVEAASNKPMDTIGEWGATVRWPLNTQTFKVEGTNTAVQGTYLGTTMITLREFYILAATKEERLKLVELFFSIAGQENYKRNYLVSEKGDETEILRAGYELDLEGQNIASEVILLSLGHLHYLIFTLNLDGDTKVVRLINDKMLKGLTLPSVEQRPEPKLITFTSADEFSSLEFKYPHVVLNKIHSGADYTLILADILEINGIFVNWTRNDGSLDDIQAEHKAELTTLFGPLTEEQVKSIDISGYPGRQITWQAKAEDMFCQVVLVKLPRDEYLVFQHRGTESFPEYTKVFDEILASVVLTYEDTPPATDP